MRDPTSSDLAGRELPPAQLVRDRLQQLASLSHLATATDAEFRGVLFDLGLAWVSHPVGQGGLGAPARLQNEVDEAVFTALGRRVDRRGFAALQSSLVAPTLVAHGSAAVQQRFVRRLFTGQEVWCQLFSEPGAGSDLAGLATLATREGRSWRISGQKVWTTQAHVADRGLLLARTDVHGPKHKGITAFALDMRAEGVSVRPLRSMTGEAEFNEVFLDGVLVSDDDRIGEPGAGWAVAVTALAHERGAIGGSGKGSSSKSGGAIGEALRIWNGCDSAIKASNRDRLVRLWVEAEVLRMANMRFRQLKTRGEIGAEGSIAKLMFAELNMRVYEFCVDLLGPAGLVGYDFEMQIVEQPRGYVGTPGSARTMFLRSRANSIEGGTSEIQRNILAERVLGLPGETRLDKNVPWSDVRRT